MDNIIKDWAQVGAEVIFDRGVWGSAWGRKSRIVKVHKTGRFLIEGDARQWTPSNRGTAHSRSDSGSYNRAALRLLTPALQLEIERDVAVRAAKAIIHAHCEQLTKLARGNNEDAILAMSAWVASMEATPQPPTGKESE